MNCHKMGNIMCNAAASQVIEQMVMYAQLHSRHILLKVSYEALHSRVTIERHLSEHHEVNKQFLLCACPEKRSGFRIGACLSF